jgi:hypothetical protein
MRMKAGVKLTFCKDRHVELLDALRYGFGQSFNRYSVDTDAFELFGSDHCFLPRDTAGSLSA